MATPARGEVISFYSYKGGVGRTMALANVACAMAETEKAEVLAVDWDLEAPGLDRFFESIPGQVQPYRGSEEEPPDRPGVLDLFGQVLAKLKGGTPRGEDEVRTLLASISLEDFFAPSGVPRVFLMGAGRRGQDYGDRVNAFPWSRVYEQAPSVFRLLAETLADRFRYVLVDSRTGLTDSAGICTMLLPEKLVVVFTPSRQSLTGVTGLISRATAYRQRSDDLRPLVVYPLASRIDATEEDLRREWRFGNGATVLVGYQRQFERVLEAAYNLPTCDLTEYFDEVAIQHVPSYAYGEQVAVLAEPSGDRLSLARSYRRFTSILTKDIPWELGAAGTHGQIMFFDRQAEMSQLRAALQRDDPSLVLMDGAAGTGKSALLLHFADECRTQGMRVAVVDLKTFLAPVAVATEILAQLGLLDPQQAGDRPPAEPEPTSENARGVYKFLAQLAEGSRPCVVLMDNADGAYPVVKNWLEVIVNEATNVAPAVLLVIAGRGIHDDLRWSVDRLGPSGVRLITLGTLDADAFLQVITELGILSVQTEPALRELARSLAGRGLSPGEILAMADLLAKLVSEP